MKDMDSKDPAKGGGKVKRQAVMDMGGGMNAADPKACAEYVPKFIKKENDIRELIMNIVTTNILFSSYAGDEHSAIVDAFESVNVDAETVVIQQGENGDNFYVVQIRYPGNLYTWKFRAAAKSGKFSRSWQCFR